MRLIGLAVALAVGLVAAPLAAEGHFSDCRVNTKTLDCRM